MIRFKYLLNKHNESFILLPTYMTHPENIDNKRWTSAGFCVIRDDGEVECYGQSVLLNLKADKVNDSKILSDFFKGDSNEN